MERGVRLRDAFVRSLVYVLADGTPSASHPYHGGMGRGCTKFSTNPVYVFLFTL